MYATCPADVPYISHQSILGESFRLHLLRPVLGFVDEAGGAVPGRKRLLATQALEFASLRGLQSLRVYGVDGFTSWACLGT